MNTIVDVHKNFSYSQLKFIILVVTFKRIKLQNNNYEYRKVCYNKADW